MRLYEPSERAPLLPALLLIWESSVRATHHFLSESEIRRIKDYVPRALGSVEHLIVAENDRLEMLFLAPAARGKGLGGELLRYGIRHYQIREVTVNEQNPQAVGFYRHMGFVPYKRTSHDEQGAPYPLLYMRLP